MHIARRATLVLAAVSLGIATSPARLAAQARSSVEFGRVGNISQPGISSGIREFQRYSYGMGGLRGAAGGASSNVLSREMTRSGFDIRRTDPADYPDALGLSTAPAWDGPAMSSVQRYAAPTGIIEDFADTRGVLGESGPESLGAAFAYLDTFTRDADEGLLEARSEPITSLVPEGDGMYARYMRKAEEAFRGGQYHEAIGSYRLAQQIGRTDPESHLGMLHARLALSSGVSYSSAAYHLTQAIRYFPELPMVPLQPRAFFEDDTRYATVVAELETRLDRSPRDLEAALCLAYLRWFDGDAPAAKHILDNAARFGTNAREDLMEAVETFRDGIRRAESGPEPAAEPPSETDDEDAAPQADLPAAGEAQ